MVTFGDIYQLAVERKGGEQNLRADLPKIQSFKQLVARPDNAYLALMTKTVFQAGFVWKVIEHKWQGFEEAFHGFDIPKLLSLTDEEWETYSTDTRIVRNMQKVYATRHNARFVEEICQEHGGFGKFLASWAADDQIGLIAVLKKRAARLGGMSGQYILRRVGWDGFMLTKDVVTCLNRHKVISGEPRSQKDLAKVQQTFNHWRAETQLPYTHLSMIMARSVG